MLTKQSRLLTKFNYGYASYICSIITVPWSQRADGHFWPHLMDPATENNVYSSPRISTANPYLLSFRQLVVVLGSSQFLLLDSFFDYYHSFFIDEIRNENTNPVTFSLVLVDLKPQRPSCRVTREIEARIKISLKFPNSSLKILIACTSVRTFSRSSGWLNILSKIIK